MSRIAILVEPPGRQAAQQVHVQDDIPLSIVIANLVAELNLAAHDGSVVYQLEWQGQRLSEHETLQNYSVGANDYVQIRSLSMSAPVAAGLSVSHVKDGFAYLPRPNAAARVTSAGLGARLVILSAPNTGGRTAPIPVPTRPVPSATPPPARPVATQTNSPTRTPPKPLQPNVGTTLPLVMVPPPVPSVPPTPSVKGGAWVGWGFFLVLLLVVVFFLGRQNGGVPVQTAFVVVTAPSVANTPQSAVTVVTVVVSGPTVVVPSSSAVTIAPAAVSRTRTEIAVMQPTIAHPAPTPIVVERPRIISRSEWGAKSATGVTGRQTPDKLVLTHDAQPISGDEDILARLRAVQRVHQGRGWPDISWHYIVDGNGNIYEGRSPMDRGDTSYDFDTNGMLMIGVLGNYDTQQPNQAQLEAIAGLMAWLCQEYSLSPDTIYAHSYFANQSSRTNPKITSPGRNFSIPDLQSDVRRRLARMS